MRTWSRPIALTGRAIGAIQPHRSAPTAVVATSFNRPWFFSAIPKCLRPAAYRFCCGRGFGVAAFSVDVPERCGDTLREALQVRGPALIEAVVDLHEPPIPPKATMKQVAHLAEALAREISGRPARTCCCGKAEALWPRTNAVAGERRINDARRRLCSTSAPSSASAR
jgi:hypothetical protein